MSNAMLETGDDPTGGFGQTPGKDKEPRWDEKIRWFALPDDSISYQYRLIGKPTFFFNHWVTTKKKDGNWGKPFAVLCKNFDSNTGKFVQNGCKVCEFYQDVNKVYGDMKVEYEKWNAQLKKMGARSTMAINAIIREIQAIGAPPGAKDWTFVMPIKLPKGVAETITDKAKKHNRKPGAAKDDEKGFYGFNHAEFGKDVKIAYNSQADAQKMYDLEIGDKSPLTPEELLHAKYMTGFVEHIKYMSDQKAEELLQRSGYYDMLQALQAQAALKKAQAQVGLNTQAPAATEIPRTPPAQQAAAIQSPAPQVVSGNPPARDVTPAAVPASMAVEDDGGMTATEDGVPNEMNQSAQSTQSAAPAVSPVQAPAQAVAPSGGAKEPAAIYAAQVGRGTKIVQEDYSSLSLRSVKTGSEVPECFSFYGKNKAAAPEVCKGCPVKLDCMQVEA